VLVGTFVAACTICLGMARPAHAVPVFRDGFESGTSNWTLTGTWRLISDAHTGSYSLTDSPSGNYANNTDTAATMVSDVDLAAATSRALVSFWLKGTLAQDWDTFTVEASTDSGATWTGLWGGLRGSNWNQGYQYLSVLGTIAKARFRLHLVTDASGTADGVYVDDFLVDDGREYAIITSPNGGEIWAGGTIHNITWANNSVTEPPASFRLLYSTDGGATYPNTIATGIAGTANSYSWTVPSINSATVRVRIDALDAAGSILFETTSAWTDTSDANFAIDSTLPNTFDLSSPTNGAWCSPTCTFAWVGDTNCGSISHDLYIDGALRRSVQTGCGYDEYTLTAAEALSQGFHTWYVVAKDPAGNTRQSTSTWSVQVDTVPPTAPTLVAPAENAWVGTDTPTFSWTGATDSGSGLAGFEIWVNGTAQTTGLGPSVLSSPAPIPPKSIFLDGFDSCAGWTMAPIPPSAYNWSCDLQSDINSYALDIYALATSGTIGSTATSGVIDLSNVGHALLALHESICGAQTYQVSASDGSAAGFRLVRDTPATNCRPWLKTSLPFDDFTGGSSSALRFTGVATPFNAVSVDSVEIQGVTGGPYSWQVVAVDVAGNRTPSESRTLRYDLPPVPFDVVGPSGWTVTATPTLSWNATTDAGSGLAKYQIWIDGSLAIDNIAATATSATPTVALTDGTHTWQVYAVDAAGAFRRSRQKPALSVDTIAPAAFSLASPADGSVSVSPTPSLCWNQSSDSGSGLDHYQLVIDGAMVRDGISDPGYGQVCATPTAAIAVGAHSWSAKAIDLAGNVRTSTDTWTIYFGVVPEPSRDAGADTTIDSPIDAAPDGPTATATSTSTATNTLTTTGTTTATNTGSATVTHTATATTSTVTATGTAVSPEPQHDAAPPITVADAATLDVIPDLPIRVDAIASRDSAVVDAMPGAADIAVITPASDASGSVVSDGGVVFADAATGTMRDAEVVGRDGGQTHSQDGAGNDGAVTNAKPSSGCGCVVGGGKTETEPTGFWSLLVLGFLALWRGFRPCRRRIDQN
jgi:MYXO-CTERM domain-containing protein